MSNNSLNQFVHVTNLPRSLHQTLALWAADCAEHVLPVFEQNYPEDNRPRQAIEAVRAWVRGELTVGEVRKFAFTAHAAARSANNPKAIAAARSAGHAAATAHVASHAQYAARYAHKASDNPESEKDWQMLCLPEEIRK